MKLTDSNHVVAYQGIEGAHSDVACRKYLPYARALPCPSFYDVFEAVASRRATLGMVPVENSVAGRVGEIHKLLSEADVAIVGEYFHRMEHQLLGVKGSHLEGVRTVFSHPQAIDQCRRFLRRHAMEAIPYSDTARAAEHVAKLQDPHVAAIASPLAGTLYGLSALAEAIHDERHNMTQYVLIASAEAEHERRPDTRFVTSAVFQTRNIPAGLYKALGGFATGGINLLKIESYLSATLEQTNAQFFVTFEGSVHDRAVQLALEEVTFFSIRLRVLGTYPADPHRFGGAGAEE